MDEKLLTISIAAYNVEKYIRQTLESLIDEEIIDDLEILVIDDGGTDKTLGITKEYADKYPESIFPIHKENGGYGSTINFGIELAHGKYFKQLDGDDWFNTNNLKDLMKILQNATADCIVTEVSDYIDKTGEITVEGRYDYLEEGEFTLEESGITNNLTMHSTAFKSEILKNMPFRLTENCLYTDTEYCTFPIPYINTILISHKDIYTYRLGAEGQSMNAASVANHYKESELVFWRIFDVYCDVSTDKIYNKQLIRYTLEKKLAQYYRFLCILPRSKSIKREIITFIKKTKLKCPEIVYQTEKISKLVKAMDFSHCFAYPVLSWWVKKQWKENGRLL